MSRYYMIDRIKKGQQKTFKCKGECGKRFDFSKSEEYAEAVGMWKVRGNMCVGCYYKKQVN